MSLEIEPILPKCVKPATHEKKNNLSFRTPDTNASTLPSPSSGSRTARSLTPAAQTSQRPSLPPLSLSSGGHRHLVRSSFVPAWRPTDRPTDLWALLARLSRLVLVRVVLAFGRLRGTYVRTVRYGTVRLMGLGFRSRAGLVFV